MKKVYKLVIYLVIFLAGCKLNQLEPALPTWSVDWFIPLAKLDYTMHEAVNDSTIFADSTNYEYPVLIINVEDSSDKEQISPNDLAIKPADQQVSGGIGDAVIDSSTAESRKITPGELLDRDLEGSVGQTITVPNATVTPEDVKLRFRHIQEARIREGTLQLEIENQSFVNYRANLRIEISDSLGESIGESRFSEPIPAYSRGIAEPLDLAGKEITGTLILTMHIPLARDEHLVTSDDLDDYTIVIGHMSELVIDEGTLDVEKITLRDSISITDEDDRIIEGKIKEGGSEIIINNYMNLNGTVTIRLLNFFRSDGSVYEKDVPVTANQPATDRLNFAGLSIQNREHINDIIEYFQLEAIVKPNQDEGPVTISDNDSIFVTLHADSIFFEWVRGILAPRTFRFDPVEKNNILDVEDIEGSIQLNDFEMSLDVYNALGIDMLLTLNMVGYRKDRSGMIEDTISLLFNDNTNKFTVEPGTNDLPIRTNLILNKSNSNIVDFMAFLPTDIKLWGQADLSGEGYVSLDHAVWALYQIYSPLFLEIPDDIFAITDISTIETEKDVRDEIDHINYALLQLEVENGLPIGAQLAVHISTDSLDLFSDAISDPAKKIIVENIMTSAAEVDESGYVAQSVIEKNNIRLDEEQMKIFQNELLFAGVKGRLGKTSGVVKFRTSDAIQSNGFIKVNYQMNPEE
jgi:hypothetical protein